jgi:hypothetical protein
LRLKLEKDSGESQPVELNPAIENFAPTPVHYAVITLYIDLKISVSPHAYLEAVGERVVDYKGEPKSVSSFKLKWHTPNHFPLFEGEPLLMLPSPMNLCFPLINAAYILGWEIKSPGMIPRSRVHMIRYTGGSLNLANAEPMNWEPVG